MKLTLYGEDCRVHKGCVFVDRSRQVFKITLIQLNQSVDVLFNGEVYNREATIIQLSIENDEDKKQEAQTIINNTNINIVDSTIKKSNLK